ncbi:TPA: hypothetical protein DDZ86_03730 [Candidatus Dependentiae bacterium]|nr:MAG: Ankyrin-1 [candidate division TM6 bacterium GW2011_GWF2_43_87]HBL98726.1 hypothetical protein [Candidatus Dependentiae bacterium]
MNRIKKSLLALVVGSLAMVSHTADAMVSTKHLIGKKSIGKSSKFFKPIQSFEGFENKGYTFGKLLQLQLKESVKANENPNQSDEFVCAILNGNLEEINENLKKIRKILNAGVDVNQCNSDGFAPLFVAINRGDKEIVELLLEHGADVNISEKTMGCTPLYLACQEGYEFIAKRLLESGALVDKSTNDGYTPLLWAVKAGNKEIVELLLKYKANVNIVEKIKGGTPLYLACQNGYEFIVKRLLESGALVNKGANDGSTPLYIACQNGYEFIVKHLLDSGALVDNGTNAGCTPLYIACQNEYEFIVKRLLDSKAQVDKSTNDGWTPLYIACRKGNLNIVKFLIEHKADVNKKHDDTSSPLYGVCRKESEDRVQIVKILLKEGADPDDSVLHFACLSEYVKMATALIKGNANINLKSPECGLTPLIIACLKNNYEMVERLVALGANVSLCGDFNTSPLHAAVITSNKKIIEFLVNNKADLWVTNDEGKTARMLARSMARSEISKKKRDNYKKIEDFLEKQENLQTPSSLKNSKNLNTNFVKEKKLKIDGVNGSIEDDHTDSVLNDHMNEYLENAKIWDFYNQEKSLDLTNPSSSTDICETKNYFIVSNSSSSAPWTLVLKKNNHVLMPIKNVTILSQKPDLYHTVSKIIFNTPNLFSQGRKVEYCKGKTTAEAKSLIKNYDLYEDALPSTCDIVWFPGSLFTGKSASQHLANLKKCFNKTNNSWNESSIKSYLNTIKKNVLNKTLTKQRARFGAALGIVVKNTKTTNFVIPHLFYHKKIMMNKESKM